MSKTRKFERLVVKFGGTSLADGKHVLRAVNAVVREVAKGNQVAVVVSAMGKTTDHLLEIAKEASDGKIGGSELDDILSTGERTSVRIFSAALKSKGVKSHYFDPANPDWPIITDGNFSDANPILDECRERIRRYVLPLLEDGVVPVIAGFIGKTIDGKVTTLGRGGSDTTAFILAEALEADEVILVTDVEGIMSADPKLVSSPRKLEKIDVETLVGLADSGTKFIHRKTLKYKDSSINVRVVHHANQDLRAHGTIITGGLSNELNVKLESQTPALSITVVGKEISEEPAILKELTESVRARTQLLGFSANHNSIILYMLECDKLKELLDEVHKVVLKYEQTTAMAVRKNLAFIKVRGVGLEETPGIIGKISNALRLNMINIFGMLTITSSVLFFVDWEKREEAINLIKSSLEGD